MYQRRSYIGDEFKLLSVDILGRLNTDKIAEYICGKDVSCEGPTDRWGTL